MSQERLTMRNTREILRLKWENHRSNRQIGRSLGVSPSTVSLAVSRAEACGLDLAAVAGLDDVALEARLYQRDAVDGRAERPAPDCVWVHLERKKPGVTLELLHREYLAVHPDGYQYTQFCAHYRAWVDRQLPSMRQVHRAGEKAFVDYSGKKPHFVDRQTGEIHPVELFVGVLGASNYTFAEATRSQQLADWIGSHVRMLAYFEGVPALLVPDQLRSGVSVPCRYEPEVQRTYGDLATHYNTAVLPARAGKPKDKAKVEGAVLIVQRWILARIRNEVYFSLEALNERIAELLDELNARPMRRYGVSRQDLFERLEKPLLRPLPAEPFIFGTWKKAKVNIDYHIEVERHFYSVPFALLREEVEAWLTAGTVEIFHRGSRVASHARSHRPGAHTTSPEHMPAAHRAHQEWTPSRLIGWGRTIGPQTGRLVEAILENRRHPEQGYRSCLGLLRLGKQYGKERLEAACERVCALGAYSYKPVARMLKSGLDQVHDGQREVAPAPIQHDNIRGQTYYV